MSETLKNEPKKTAEAPKDTKKELSHIPELKKLETTSKQLESIRQKQGIIRLKKFQKSEEQDADKALLEGLGAEPGALLKTEEKTSKTFVETSESEDQKLAKELSATKSIYKMQFKNTYDQHIADLINQPEEQKKVGQKYLERSIEDLKINSGSPGENDVKFFAESLPDVWEQTLLDPKSVENNDELTKIRNAILDRVADGAASIDLEDFGKDKDAYERALLDNFCSVTGLSLTREQLKGYLSTETPHKKKFIDDIDIPDGKGKMKRNTTPKELTDNTIMSTLGVSGGGVGNYFEGSGMEAGTFSTEFPEDIGTAVMQIKGEAGKNVREGTAAGEAIIGGYFRDAGFPGNTGKTPWCMAFVQAMARRHLGYSGPKTLSAKDGLKMGNKIGIPEAGAIVVTRGSGPSGCHVGISVGNGEYISGNSGNAVKIKSIPPGAQFRSLRPSGGGH